MSKRRNIGINIEIKFTYVNLGLLLPFLCNLCSIQGHFVRFCFSLFGVAFRHNAKQRKLLCAVSTHKLLSHQRTVYRFAIKAPNPKRPDRYLISSPRHGVRSGNSITKRCVVNAFIRHVHIMHLICPPKFCISIVFNFSWDGCNTQEKRKTKVIQNLGVK